MGAAPCPERDSVADSAGADRGGRQATATPRRDIRAETGQEGRDRRRAPLSL